MRRALNSALHTAARAGRLTALRQAVRHGADLEQLCWEEGIGFMPAICTAALAGRVNAVALLLELGASVDSPNEWGGTALHMAILGGHDDILALLLERGANVEAHSEGLTPLMAAAQLGRAFAVKALLDRGASAAQRDRAGNTALDWARRYLSGEMAPWLPDGEWPLTPDRLAAGTEIVSLLETAAAREVGEERR